MSCGASTDGETPMRTKTVVCFTLLCALASNVRAQTPEGSFTGLAGKIGRSVSVTDGSGRQTKGKLTEVSPSLLALSVVGNRQTFDVATVRTVTARQRNTGRGARWGFLVGAGLGLYGAINTQECGGPDRPRCEGMDNPLVAAMFVGFMGGLGAGLGAGVGAMSTRERLIYTAPDAPSSIRLTVSAVVHKDVVRLLGAVR